MAIVILGGMASSMLYTLCVLPALYARFGAGATADDLDLDDVKLALAPELHSI